MRFNKGKRFIMVAIAGALFFGGAVFGLNGWFGGGDLITSDNLTRGLVGYWGFEEGSGITAYDGSSTAINHGTLNNMSTSTNAWTKGKVGSALQFDGTDDYVTMGNVLNFERTDTFSIALWAQSASADPTTIMNLVSKRGSSGSFTGYSLRVRGDNVGNPYRVNITNASDANELVIDFGGVSDTNWHYIVVTYDGTSLSSSIKGYIDGVLQSNTVQINTLSASISNSIPFNIGTSNNSSGFFNGLLDEVRIYNRMLSAAEVRYQYNVGGPVAQWSFNEGSGSVAYDATESNNDGTLTNGPLWVAGKYGSALYFDGVNDHVKSNSNITGASTTAYSLWFQSVDGVYAADTYLLSQGTNDPSIFIESTDSKVYVMADNANILSSSVTVSDKKWHHVEVTADGTTIRLYLDGVFQSQAPYAGSSASGLLYVGSSATPGSYFKGLIDDVRIYNYARTPEEVRLDYNSGFAAHFGPKTSCDQDPGSCMTQGLVGYWGFEEGSGALAYDTSEFGNTGTLTSGPSWTKGKVGSALSFDGSDDYVTIPASSNYVFTGDMAIELWLNKQTFAAADSNAFEFGLNAQNNHVNFLDFNTDGTFYWQTINTDLVYNAVTSAKALSLDTWYHIVLTRSNSVKYIYINGVQDQNISTHSGTIPDPNALQIGKGYWAGGYPMQGKVDDFRIYNRALSAAEIRYHYNRGGPVGYWKFDEGNGATAYDSSGNGNTGTLTNGPLWVAGKYGSALYFDGVNDHVKSNSNITGASTTAYSLWFQSVDGVYAADTYLLSQGTNDPSIFIESTDSKVYVMADNANILSSSVTVSDKKWHHMGVTADGTTIRLYLDGVLQSQANYTGSSTTGLLYIGSSATPGSYFKGLIDDVRIYNYARTPEEVRLDYNSGFAAHFGPKTSCDQDPGSCMTQGLVGYWGFEEGNGATAYDGSPTAINYGTLNGPVWTKGKVGGGLNFDGTDDYVDLGDKVDFEFNADFTISLWMKRSNSNFSYYDVLIGKGYNDVSSYVIRGSENSKALYTSFVCSVTGYVPFAETSGVVSDGVWHHIVYTRNGTQITEYIDGINKTTATCSGTTGVNNYNLNFGYDPGPWGTSAKYYDGSIDEVRIYNRALSATEIRYAYNRGGPVGYWKFDEGEGRTAYDSTDNNNDGTLVLAGSATSSAWVAGKYGSALSFDGTNDYVDAGSNTSLNLGSGNFTISAWFKTSVTGANQRILCKEKATANYNTYCLLVSDTTNKLVGAATDCGTGACGWGSSRNPINGATVVTDGAWHQVIYVRSGASQTLYLDGKSDGTLSEGPWDTDSTAILAIGRESGFAANYFTGSIDEVRIYNYARTPDQVLQDYNRGLGVRFK